jgi:hypothetical protein
MRLIGQLGLCVDGKRGKGGGERGGFACWLVDWLINLSPEQSLVSGGANTPSLGNAMTYCGIVEHQQPSSMP